MYRLDTPLRLLTSRLSSTVGGKRYEQVYVVHFAVELLQPAVERDAHVGEYAFQCRQMLVGKHVVPVFGDEDQVRMQIVDAVPSLTNIVCLIHKDQV